MRHPCVEFESQRDASGYTVKAVAPSAAPLNTVLTEAGEIGTSGDRLVRKGGALERVRPLERSDNLFAVFAHLKSPDEIAEFMRQNGPLTKNGNRDGEHLAAVGAAIADMRKLVDAWRATPGKLKTLVGDRLDLAKLKASVRWNGATGTFDLSLTPEHLIEALRLQFAQAVSAARALKTCRHCLTPFLVGPGTGRLSKAEFCCDEHRVTFHSLARSATKM